MDTTEPLENSDGISFPEAPRRTVPPALAARYEDITLVGEGGMGTVYRGRDPRLGRPVALKLIKGDDPALWQRFLQEAKAQARIQHAYVCRVYEAGQADGEPYIAMQYVDGQPLSRIERALTLEQNVKLIAEVAAAVHEAHRLGLIHRDIKPGNILVEPQEDGTLKPYIMDFGLARQVQEKGQTATGALVGTLAYMSPEQANGDVRSMDRRSDVYSLGATLYEAIAGRPPFVAENHWQLILKIGDGEAPALGKVKKGVPVDLETIVMKCLERDPARRYDSAKALAEDLQRFLDGDAILAKRSSWGYVLWKKARKNKLAITFGTLALIAAAIPLGAWIQSRRQMAVQVELSRRLGEDVKSNELYLRAVYELPLHDVNKERDVIRQRFEEIEKTIPQLGKAGGGPAHYAIGRGHLALGDMEAARTHLEQAFAMEYAPPELHYALGRVLGELYRQELEKSKHLSEDQRKAKIIESEKQLRDPAIDHLRAAATGVESPAYVEGLLAFYEGKYDEALEKAKNAFDDAPLMYEARKLEGDILFAQGNQYRDDAAFDYEKMMTYYKPAADAYAMAANIGRSDPDVHRAECAFWPQVMNANISKGNHPVESLTLVEQACSRAITANPTDPHGRIMRAFAHAGLAFMTAQGATGLDHPIERIDQAIRLAEDAVLHAPKDALAHYVVGSAYSAKAIHQLELQRDTTPYFARSKAAFEEASKLEPLFAWAFQDAASLYESQILHEGSHGRDPSPLVLEGMKLVNAAKTLAPNAPFVLQKEGSLNSNAARVLTENGRNADEPIRRALGAFKEMQRLSPKMWLSHNNIADVYTIDAQYDVLTGNDASSSLQHARDAIERAKKCGGGLGALADTIGELHRIEALDALQHDRDPTQSIAAARDAYRTTMKAVPWSVRSAANQTRVEIIALRWAMKQHNATTAMFDAAFAPLASLFSYEIANPSVYVTLAEVHALRAQWLVESKKDAKADINKGISLTDKALAIHPQHGRAFAVEGKLLLVQALASRESSEKTKAASEAQKAFARAFKEMPILEKEYGAMAQDAANLIE